MTDATVAPSIFLPTGGNCFKDPFILSGIGTGKWSSNSFTISNNTIIAGQDGGTTILMAPALELTVGLYYFAAEMVGAEVGGVRPIVGSTQHDPITTNGRFERLLRVTDVGSQFVGFRDYEDTDANIVGPLICVRLGD